MDRRYVLLIATTLLCSCNDESKNESSATQTAADCKGIYYQRDAYGDLKKFNQYWLESSKACLTDQIALTNYEASTEKRRKHNVNCVPQPNFPSMALKASSNYYSYRDDRYYLDFDASTGQFRRITLGEDKDSNVVYQRDVSCFYAREDHETEPVNPQDYGKQLLLDFSNFPASSADFVPNEIFSYTNDGNGNWFLTRYDDVADWGFSFCPTGTTPFEFCTERRNGNIYFDPVLDVAVMAALTTEAKLIRTQFNFGQITRSEFEQLWQSYDKNGKELQQGGDWKFFVNHVVDASKFFDYNWRRYLMGLDPTMPDAASAPQLPPVCYSGSKYINLVGGGTGKVYGEICVINGQYTFTQY
ncbi:MAG: hypothetical protein BroJett040_10130 [Oligoflexia bacterium]|nr:MAG: hypothetical protein BroJett040_10130 [Oligoflexia bacterium]